MSFLYDLYDEAIYSNFLQKTAQGTPPPDLPPFQDSQESFPNSVAKKLVNKLSKEIAGTKEDINISSNSAVSVDLGVNQLQNLGKLLQFMTSAQIKIDGARVAYTENEANALPEEERNKLSPVSVNMSRDLSTRKWSTADFYTNLPLLTRYVSYLQNKAFDLKSKGDVQGRILEVMIGKLIDSINSIKPDSGLSRKPMSEPGKPNELPDETVLDGFGTKVFDIKDPYSDKGPLKLTAKDLASRESLNAWMRQEPEAQIVSGLPPPSQIISGQSTSVKYTAPNANHCIIINTLYKRALNLSRTAASAEEAKKYNFYLNKISQIGPSFTDPQGKACSVTSASSSITGRQNFFGPDAGGQTDRSKSIQTNQIIEKIVQSLPLDIQDIDFNRIKNFFNLYSQIASSDNAASAYSSMEEANKFMFAATSLTATGNQTNFRLTRNIQELLGWLKTSSDPGKLQSGNYALQFLHALQQVILETGKVIGMFYNEYARTLYSGDRKVLNNEQKSLVEAQYLGGNSIYSQNLREIQALMYNFQNALGMKK